MVNSYLIYCYFRIYSEFLTYHGEILEEFKDGPSRHDVRLVKHSNAEVRFFFSQIMIMIFVQSLYLASTSIETVTSHIWGDRFKEIMNVILNFTYILLYYSISQSVDRSFN